MSSEVKVSVAIITYNQEDFIAEALDSVLMQDVDFRFQVVVGDDHSTDSTSEILKRYQTHHPDKIKIVNHERNVGAAQNMLDTLNACEGEYVASLDGDDYWTSPLKLQKLAAMLDTHPDCPMCFNNTRVIFQNGNSDYDFWRPTSKSLFNTRDLLKDSGAITSATMWRRDILLHVIPETLGVAIGDKARAIVASQFGDIGYVAETMSVWRIHQAGSFSHGNPGSIENNIRKGTDWFQFYQFVDNYFDGEYNDALIPDITLQHYVMFKAYLRKRDLKSCVYHLSHMFYSEASRRRKQLNSVLVATTVATKLLAADIMRMPEMSKKLIKSDR